MPVHKQRTFRGLAVALLAMGMTMSVAQADDDEHEERYGGENRGGSLQSAQTSARFQQECSACHIAYAPGLLPAESWRKVMAGLDKHFGSDASLDAQDNKEITAFLVNNASRRNDAAAPLRISETAWFKRKHDGHEIDPRVWKSPQVKSPANCAACHPRAERGGFSERDIRIPR